jgi:hypothetical protein
MSQLPTARDRIGFLATATVRAGVTLNKMTELVEGAAAFRKLAGCATRSDTSRPFRKTGDDRCRRNNVLVIARRDWDAAGEPTADAGKRAGKLLWRSQRNLENWLASRYGYSRTGNIARFIRCKHDVDWSKFPRLSRSLHRNLIAEVLATGRTAAQRFPPAVASPSHPRARCSS